MRKRRRMPQKADVAQRTSPGIRNSAQEAAARQCKAVALAPDEDQDIQDYDKD